jgi:orotate phosphoribosyltransferase
MTSTDVMDLLRRYDAIKEGHFRLTSGLHSPIYFEKFQVLQHPEAASFLCAEIARRFEGDGVELVIGPAIGGIIIAYEVARHLGARFIFAEKEDGRRVLRRGFRIMRGERTLVVEDVVTTGGSAREVIELVRSSGGIVIGIGFIVDRTGGKVDFGVRKESLLSLEVPAYMPEECPLCRDGIPLEET